MSHLTTCGNCPTCNAERTALKDRVAEQADAIKGLRMQIDNLQEALETQEDIAMYRADRVLELQARLEELEARITVVLHGELERENVTLKAQVGTLTQYAGELAALCRNNQSAASAERAAIVADIKAVSKDWRDIGGPEGVLKSYGCDYLIGRIESLAHHGGSDE